MYCLLKCRLELAHRAAISRHTSWSVARQWWSKTGTIASALKHSERGISVDTLQTVASGGRESASATTLETPGMWMMSQFTQQ